MSRKVERVLVIQEASGELSTDAIRWTLQRLSLKPGDKIKIIRVVQPFSTAKISSSSFLGCAIPKRYKIRLHSSVTIKNKQKGIEEYIAEKKDEYQNSAEIKEIRRLPQMQQIELDIVVEAGNSLREVAVQAAKELQATWVILDRNMKKDEKYLKENLTCGILRMKHNGQVEHVREPKVAETDRVIPERGYTRLVNLETSTSEEEEEIFRNAVCSVCKNRRPRIGVFREFEYSELQFSTDGFSDRNVLSQRGKEIYKGCLLDGQRIVVRKSNLAKIKEEEFQSRVQMLGMARHENVAMLLGSCSRKHLRLLVYEYVCNSSLNAHLTRRSKLLTWERRMKIATGVAKGLMYLHSNNIYGNLRPNNILITHDYEPLLANIGLTRNQYEGLDHSSETRVLKTFEYLAPEYEETGINSSKTDIYSFGVVLLELITGRKTIEETCGQSFLRWARPLVEEKRYGELADPTLPEQPDIHQLFWMVRVAEKCLSANPRSRHPIEKVADELTRIIQGERIEDFSPTESELLEKTRR